MKWAFKIARIAGIDVKVHSTFFLLLIWLGYSYWTSQQSVTAVVNGLIFVLLLFLFVIMHEFGHALAARRFNIQTADITLLPIGGVARLEKMPDDPKEELWVAFAGPLVNLVLAIVFFIWVLLSQGVLSLTQISMNSAPLIQRLALVNLALFLFNLIPAFPMDGGRILRSLLAIRMDYEKATNAASTLGKLFAFIFAMIGLFINPFYLLIALFVWIGASQENQSVKVRNLLSGIPVKEAMLTNYETLSSKSRLSDGIQAILAGYQQDFPVLDGEKMVGILTRQRLLQALAFGDTSINILSVMDHTFERAQINEMLQEVAERLQACGCRTVPVFDGEKLIGLITMDNIGEFMMIRSALKRAGKFPA
jgi:Zn-dependent protease